MHALLVRVCVRPLLLSALLRKTAVDSPVCVRVLRACVWLREKRQSGAPPRMRCDIRGCVQACGHAVPRATRATRMWLCC